MGKRERSERSRKIERGLGKAGRRLSKTPFNFLSLELARFSNDRPNDREAGKAKAAKPLVVHPGSKPRLQRPGR